MKGIVFNLLEEVVRREHGEDTWDALLDSAGVDGSFTSLGSYPDEQMMKLVEAACAGLNMPGDSVLQWFGRLAMPLLAERYSSFFSSQGTTRDFLLTLNNIIHPEVRKLYPGVHVPVFDFDTSSSDVLLMGYRSERRLCALAEGFIEGAADFYGEAVTISQAQCLRRGDARCLFEVRFPQKLR